jgi:hypothetical protein
LVVVAPIFMRNEFGPGFAHALTEYVGFSNEPSFTDYQGVVDGSFNLFRPLPYKPTPGGWPNIEKMLRHVFEDQYDMALNYLWVVFNYPSHPLPVLCLVSKQQGTGKTAFLELLTEHIFPGNGIIVSNSDFRGEFNSAYATKLIIGIDESDLDYFGMSSRVKQMSTQKKVVLTKKFADPRPVDFVGKLIFCSNKETSFLRVEHTDRRYWIRKLPPLSDQSPRVKWEAFREVPQFVHYLLNEYTPAIQEPLTSEWFRGEDIHTEWKDAAIEESRSALYHALREFATKIFNEHTDLLELVGTATDYLNAIPNKDIRWTVKSIGRVMREEFGIETGNKTTRNEPTAKVFTISTKGSARWYILERKDIMGEEE